MAKSSLTHLVLVGLIVSLWGCQKSPEAARSELGQMSVEYTPEAFVQAASNNDLPAIWKWSKRLGPQPR